MIMYTKYIFNMAWISEQAWCNLSLQNARPRIKLLKYGRNYFIMEEKCGGSSGVIEQASWKSTKEKWGKCHSLVIGCVPCIWLCSLPLQNIVMKNMLKGTSSIKVREWRPLWCEID